jgi:hypothetical protein
MNCLIDERVIGDLAFADQILGARDLIRKHRTDQVFRTHARELRRHLLAALETRQRERHAGDPAPAGDEHRRVQHRLDQQLADRRRVEIARDLGKLERMCRGQREDDVVLGRRRLQLEIELAAKAFAQRKAPGAIDAAAIRRMHDELHSAGFIKEPL